MKVVGVERIHDFIRRHANACNPLAAWLMEARNAEWLCPQDIKQRYSSASFLAGNCVIFNIGGNKFRLETKVAYNAGVVVVVRVGTHSEYDRWES